MEGEKGEMKKKKKREQKGREVVPIPLMWVGIKIFPCFFFFFLESALNGRPPFLKSQ